MEFTRGVMRLVTLSISFDVDELLFASCLLRRAEEEARREADRKKAEEKRIKYVPAT